MNIIFVCTGNTCRSPMAEAYLKSKKLSGLNVCSRGFSDGEKANQNSVEVMKEIDIDIGDHMSKYITADEAQSSDLIVCMSDSHKYILTANGVDGQKIKVLNIDDPFGCDKDTYRKCRDSIINAIDNLISNGCFDEIKISRATPDDVDAIAEIEKVVFSTPWSQNAISESMNESTDFYIAKKDDVIAGYMGVSKIAGEGYVTNIAVLPQHRRKGIATAMLKYVIHDCRNTLEFISLEVRVSNKNAISLYEKFDFKQVGLRKRFYTNPDEDALIMTKTLVI